MGEMHGARRVVTFCLLTAVLPTILLVIPLYLRHSLYADVNYSVAESDVLEAVEGISTVFCQEQILRMNSTFRAFQLKQMPALSNQKRHIQLRKTMTLPDDTVEYWGFYLLAGSNITLHACSRFQGAGVVIVKGEKNLKTCNSLEPSHKGLKYQKGSKSINVPQSGKSRETRASRLLRDSMVHQDFQDETKSSTIHMENKNSSNVLNDKPDVLDKLTKEIRQIITKYPSNKDTLQSSESDYVEEKLKPQLSSDQENPSSISTQSLDQSTAVTDDTEESARHKKSVHLLARQLQNGDIEGEEASGSIEDLLRTKRKSGPLITGHVLDAAVGHGGNANATQDLGESSDSSFEESLKSCYEGQIIDFKEIYPTPKCHGNYPLNHHKVETVHITLDGYYYFVFFSDNDYNQNPIHAHFDLFKTTYLHTNFTRGCINQTECRFPITFWSSEIVIVEIPTYDGIEHEDGDASILVSSCYPRMSIYAVFPVAVLFLILGCAFM